MQTVSNRHHLELMETTAGQAMGRKCIPGMKGQPSLARGKVSAVGLMWLPENMSAHSRLTITSSSLLCHLVLSFLLPTPMETASCLSNKCFFPKEPGQAKITRKQVKEREHSLCYPTALYLEGQAASGQRKRVCCSVSWLTSHPAHSRLLGMHSSECFLQSLHPASGLDQGLCAVSFFSQTHHPTHQHNLLTPPPKGPRIQPVLTLVSTLSRVTNWGGQPPASSQITEIVCYCSKALSAILPQVPCIASLNSLKALIPTGLPYLHCLPQWRNLTRF